MNNRAEKEKTSRQKSKSKVILYLILSLVIITFIFSRLLNNFFPFLLLFLLLLAVGAVMSFHSLIQYRRILRQAQSITSSETEEIILYHPTVKFLTRAEMIGRYRSQAYITGIELIDEKKGKYTYLFKTDLKVREDTARKIKEKLQRELHVQCYCNTRILRFIENDPHFFAL